MLRATPYLLLGALLAAVPAVAAADDAEKAPENPYSVKISLSRDDANVQTGTVDGDGVAEFFLFIDGAPSRGAEFGISIEGGELLAFIIATEKAWVTLPFDNPYPGTVAQVRAGDGCEQPPVYMGRMLVKPDQPGGRVALDVAASLRAAEAVILHCDNTGTLGFEGYPAVVNGKALPSHPVENFSKSAGPHDHDHDHDEAKAAPKAGTQ